MDKQYIIEEIERIIKILDENPDTQLESVKNWLKDILNPCC